MKQFNPSEVANVLGNLWSRWMCEKEYEDFNDYVDVMKRVLEERGCKLKSFKRRPFMITFTLASGELKWMKSTSSDISWGGFRS